MARVDRLIGGMKHVGESGLDGIGDGQIRMKEKMG